MKTQTKAAIFLLIFSSVSAELISGSSPPMEYFGQMALVFLVPFYGIGAILVNEAAIRWGKGWPTILLLGAAWGIFEEGIVVMSFFNPGWVDLGPLGDYGRLFGVNWVWSVNVTVFHMIWSIAIPIMLMRMIFPQVESSVLVRTRTAVALSMALILVSALLSISISRTMGYAAPLPLFLGAVIAMLLVIAVAKRMPVHLLADPGDAPTRKPLRYYLVGLGFATGFFITNFVIPWTNIYSIIDIFIIVALVLLSGRYLEKNIGRRSNDMHKLALVGGLCSVWILFAFIHELSGGAGMAGMAVVAVLYIVFLLWCRRMIARRTAVLPTH